MIKHDPIEYLIVGSVMVSQFTCCHYFCRHLKTILTEGLTEGNELALWVPWEASPRQQDRVT